MKKTTFPITIALVSNFIILSSAQGMADPRARVDGPEEISKSFTRRIIPRTQHLHGATEKISVASTSHLNRENLPDLVDDEGEENLASVHSYDRNPNARENPLQNLGELALVLNNFQEYENLKRDEMSSSSIRVQTEEAEDTSDLLALPPELIDHMLGFMPAESLDAFELTNQKLRQFAYIEFEKRGKKSHLIDILISRIQNGQENWKKLTFIHDWLQRGLTLLNMRESIDQRKYGFSLLQKAAALNSLRAYKKIIARYSMCLYRPPATPETKKDLENIAGMALISLKQSLEKLDLPEDQKKYWVAKYTLRLNRHDEESLRIIDELGQKGNLHAWYRAFLLTLKPEFLLKSALKGYPSAEYDCALELERLLKVATNPTHEDIGSYIRMVTFLSTVRIFNLQKLAIDFLTDAAEKGHALSQVKLGEKLWEAKKYEQSLYYWNLAAKQGNGDALLFLKHLEIKEKQSLT